MNRLALFDCDGTLVDSQANICRAMEEAFAHARLDVPDRAAIRRIVGLSLVEAVAALIPDAEPELHVHVAQGYRDRFIEMRRSGGLAAEPLYEGIAETINTLDARGWVLGVATGKSDRGLHLLLEHHGLKHRFVTLQTADRHPSKPHPAMLKAAMIEAGATAESTVMIGDTSYDMAMAVTARAHPLGVSWGYHDAGDLIAAGAAQVLDQPGQIADYLERI